MKYFSIVVIIIVTICSCSKKEDVIQTYTGNLPIISTTTPATALVGHDIISNVHCELGSVSGTVIFQGFEIKETAERKYSLNAKALYKNWNTQIAMPVIWALDTTSNIKATTTGQYILNFYNSTQLVKSDTVQVN